jgi:peptide/nickel transport system permease protein
MSGRLRFLRRPSGAIGVTILLFVIAVALLGPLVAPHPPNQPVGIPLTGSSGTDLAAGYSRSLVDPLLMRSVDVLLCFPPLLFLLVLIAGAGSSVLVLIIGVAVVQAPQISRIVRTATLEVSTRGYVEAAIARGERAPAVILREVLPNILVPVLVDAGLRFTYSILIIASVNFLGLGLQPPSSDWALMIGQNRSYLAVNAWSVLAPAAMIAILTIGVNLTGDAVARTLGRSYVPRTMRPVSA